MTYNYISFKNYETAKSSFTYRDTFAYRLSEELTSTIVCGSNNVSSPFPDKDIDIAIKYTDYQNLERLMNVYKYVCSFKVYMAESVKEHPWIVQALRVVFSEGEYDYIDIFVLDENMYYKFFAVQMMVVASKNFYKLSSVYRHRITDQMMMRYYNNESDESVKNYFNVALPLLIFVDDYNKGK